MQRYLVHVDVVRTDRVIESTIRPQNQENCEQVPITRSRLINICHPRRRFLPLSPRRSLYITDSDDTTRTSR